jgi:hypothetical protein
VTAVLLAACTALIPLTPSRARTAAREGTAMADTMHGYAVKPWVIYQSADPLRAVHGRAGVDAIAVETPYERVRFEAYLHRLQGERITAARVRAFFEKARDRLGFLVYVHSRGQDDGSFLTQFHAPSLILPGGTAVVAMTSSIFGPSGDFYDVGSFREERLIGSITYGFALPACAGPMQLELIDGYGDRYAVRFDLRSYR